MRADGLPEWPPRTMEEAAAADAREAASRTRAAEVAAAVAEAYPAFARHFAPQASRPERTPRTHQAGLTATRAYNLAMERLHDTAAHHWPRGATHYQAFPSASDLKAAELYLARLQPHEQDLPAHMQLLALRRQASQHQESSSEEEVGGASSSTAWNCHGKSKGKGKGTAKGKGKGVWNWHAKGKGKANDVWTWKGKGKGKGKDKSDQYFGCQPVVRL